MTLPASGAISLGQVNTELGRGATATLGLGDSAVRTLFGIASGAIDMNTGHGKTNGQTVGFNWQYDPGRISTQSPSKERPETYIYQYSAYYGFQNGSTSPGGPLSINGRKVCQILSTYGQFAFEFWGQGSVVSPCPITSIYVPGYGTTSTISSYLGGFRHVYVSNYGQFEGPGEYGFVEFTHPWGCIGPSQLVFS